jgi:hypothetical protein
LPLWRRNVFFAGDNLARLREKTPVLSSAVVALRQVLSNCSKSRGHAPVRSAIGCSIFTAGIVEKNFDKAFRATNKRVVRTRDSGPTESEASVNRTRVIR